MDKVELLAPAGEMNALIAAVQNGADAVYLGGRMFGARASASNFDGDGLRTAVEYAHKRGVKVYMTVNTLVRDSELPRVYELVRDAVEAGIDAAIVQDLGVTELLHRCFPALHLHASTQMTILNERGAQYVREMGMMRVVPARECTQEEIAAIARTGLEVEVFVHGALCVSYSGQCLLSSMIGGRSGNRGRCAQPCRLPYQMNGVRKHFLSPADLCTLGDLDRIVRAGATSLKIEGRLKRPEYVAAVTAAYRRALDRVIEGKPADLSDLDGLKRIFNRGGFTRGYIAGKNDAGIMATERPNHWGVRVGQVLSVKSGRARVRLDEPLHAGDGLEARGRGGDHGVLVQSVEGKDIRVPEGVRPGDVLFRTTDAEQLRTIRESYAQERRKKPVDAHFVARIGQPCALEMNGQRVAGEIVQPAKGRPLDEEAVRRQLGKLGDTVLSLRRLQCDLDEEAFLPVSALNALRREAAERCEQQILWENTPEEIILPYEERPETPYCTETTALVLQSDDVEELIAAQEEADELYFTPRDFAPDALKPALVRLPLHAAVVLPTALTDEELCAAKTAIGNRRIVAGNLAQLERGCVTDVGLNAFNHSAMRQLLHLGAARITASPECTLAEAERLARTAPVEWIVYGNVPLMTLRHCPIRAEKGLDEQGRERCRICGRTGTVLMDRKGGRLRLTPYHADSGCRIQVFGPQLFSAIPEMPRIVRAGFAALRVIGTREDLLRCKAAMSGRGLEGEQSNTTFGHLYKGVE